MHGGYIVGIIFWTKKKNDTRKKKKKNEKKDKARTKESHFVKP
jgi:uncharacterized protein involved in propanediol utilization